MLTTFPSLASHIALAPEQLLTNGEIVVIVDDDASISSPLAAYLEEQGLAVEMRSNAADLWTLLRERHVALILLDIGLPDTDGVTLIPQLSQQYPDLAIIMLTGVADLQVAMDCIRKGADDYLSKPAKFNEILFVVKKTLEKRRLIFENRKYQEDLEKAHFRIQLMHQLSLKMNSVYLSTVELDEILQAILVGITANEGLRFNRAFLAMFDDAGKNLVGRMAIGATCREKAAKIWQEMQQRELKFLDIVHNIRKNCALDDSDVNSIIRKLRIPVSDTANILLRSALDRRSIKVDRRNGCVPILLERRNFHHGHDTTPYPEENDRRRNGSNEGPPLAVPSELIAILQEEDFVIVPLFSPGRPFGVIIADNFVTRNPIFDSHVSALELFASQASLAIEHSHLYMDMQNKIHELEELNHELDKNKDMLIEAERFSALGQMAAQMVHAIRNPVTSIGGISKILTKKITEESTQKYLDAVIKESNRLESILQDLFEFVSQKQLAREKGLLSDMLRKSIILLQSTIAKQHIDLELQVMENEQPLMLDEQQIRQMLMHLLKNAIEAMPDGGTLSIRLSENENRQIALSIRDTGTGISDAHIKQVTDSFFTTKTYGTGMGLTLVDRVVKAHGGTFDLHVLPVGLEVVVYLPLT